jgi:hypothetical protein
VGLTNLQVFYGKTEDQVMVNTSKGNVPHKTVVIKVGGVIGSEGYEGHWENGVRV